MQTLRILHSIRSVNPRGGGPIEGLKQMSAVNQAHGHKVEVLSLDSPSDEWVKKCPLPCHALGPARGKYGYSGRFSEWVNLNRHKYDVVVVNGIWQYNALGVWRALRGTSTPYFVYTHGMLDPWFKRHYPLKHLKKWLYWPFADYRVLRDASAVLFTCEEERRLARQSFWLYKTKECVVNYGAAHPNGESEVLRNQFLARFPHLTGKRCLLFLGRVHEKKGVDLLLRAVHAVRGRRECSDLHLVIAGPCDDTYGREMVNLGDQLDLAGSVTWTGMLTGESKWGAFYCADAFILPSHQENFGIAVAEALACGVPVLVSDQVNIWREICSDLAGFVEKDDFIGTCNLILRWMQTSDKEWRLMGSNAVRSFTNRFSVDRAAESLIEAVGRFAGCRL